MPEKLGTPPPQKGQSKLFINKVVNIAWPLLGLGDRRARYLGA